MKTLRCVLALVKEVFEALTPFSQCEVQQCDFDFKPQRGNPPLGTKYADVTSLPLTHERIKSISPVGFEPAPKIVPYAFRLSAKAKAFSGVPLGYRCASLRFAVPRFVMTPAALSEGAIDTCRSLLDLAIMYSDLG